MARFRRRPVVTRFRAAVSGGHAGGARFCGLLTETEFTPIQRVRISGAVTAAELEIVPSETTILATDTDRASFPTQPVFVF